MWRSAWASPASPAAARGGRPGGSELAERGQGGVICLARDDQRTHYVGIGGMVEVVAELDESVVQFVAGVANRRAVHVGRAFRSDERPSMAAGEVAFQAKRRGGPDRLSKRSAWVLGVAVSAQSGAGTDRPARSQE